VALAVLMPALEGRAQPSAAEAGRAAEPAATPDALRATTAHIVLIGGAADDAELPLLLGELLERQGVIVEMARERRFDPDELFEAADDRVIRVFVVFGDANPARLWFRGPNGERYLLRKVTLASGLDAVGRELLGQVVESSVSALLKSTEGMSRKEMVAAIERDEPTVEPERPPPAPRPPAAKRAAPLPSPSPWELHFGLRYAATRTGPELGLSHGPGLGIGARYRRGPSVGLELGADRRFAQALSTPALDASIERMTAHALLEAGLALSPSQSAFVALGAALELVRTRPASTASGITAASSKSDVEPALRAELRYELTLGHLVFGLAALLEGPLVKTRYELVQSGGTELLASTAPLRPGGVVTLGVRP
jgi:hypothetical protein